MSDAGGAHLSDRAERRLRSPVGATATATAIATTTSAPSSATTLAP